MRNPKRFAVATSESVSYLPLAEAELVMVSWSSAKVDKPNLNNNAFEPLAEQ